VLKKFERDNAHRLDNTVDFFSDNENEAVAGTFSMLFFVKLIIIF
jgi:hypothetical protein